MLKFVTMSFPMSWLFAIIAETRRVLFLVLKPSFAGGED